MDLKLFVFCHLVPWILIRVMQMSFGVSHLVAPAMATTLTSAGALWLRMFLRFILVLIVLVGLQRLDSHFNLH